MNSYPISRFSTYSHKGMVATSQSSAAAVGAHILSIGGNAIDAAVAMAASLTVVEPTCNGLGSDAFALIYSDNRLHGLNASGHAPLSVSREKILDRGFTQMPLFGLESVTVPGAVASWAQMIKRFGNLSFSEVLQPAIELARNGFSVSKNLSLLWKTAFDHFSENLSGDLYKPWFDTFAPLNRSPKVGEVVTSPFHAHTLELIAHSHGEAFYQGELAEKIASFSRKHDGFLSLEDLQKYEAQWVDPIKVEYRSHQVWEIPPNGQGISALMSLQMLNEFESLDREDELSVHRIIEATKLAMSDVATHVTDPRYMRVSTDHLLSPSYAKKRVQLIGEKAIEPSAGEPTKGGTVYLATADKWGNMVSFIQSNYEGFGSAVVIPETGIAMQNRGNNFSLEKDHVNCIAPNKKTYHTIIPGFITKDDAPVGPFGVMGGFNQPQGHVQVVVNTLDNKLDPQAALDAPRWRWLEKKRVLVEPSFNPQVISALKERGHDIEISDDYELYGRGQIIFKENQSLVGGCESRTDSLIALEH